jgi:membrane protein required for colicin V production
MLIDIIFVIVLLLALYKGYRKGFIVGLFSLIAIFVGLAAAIKLSAVVAQKLGHSSKTSQEWLPLLSFILVFIAVVILVYLGAKAIEGVVKMAMLGWLNRLGGMIFFAALYILVYSVLLFYLTKMNLIKEGTIHSSVTYSFVEPWAPKALDGLGKLVPLFRNMFGELGNFFEGVSKRV